MKSIQILNKDPPLSTRTLPKKIPNPTKPQKVKNKAESIEKQTHQAKHWTSSKVMKKKLKKKRYLKSQRSQL